MVAIHQKFIYHLAVVILLAVLVIATSRQVSAQSCDSWRQTQSSVAVCSTSLFQSDCAGQGGFTGTQCCTGPDVLGGPYDYCEERGYGPYPVPLKEFRCCNNPPTSTPVPTSTPIPTNTPTPTPTPTPAGCQNNVDCGTCKQCCIGSPNYCSTWGYYCSGGQIPACWPTATPTPTIPPGCTLNCNYSTTDVNCESGLTSCTGKKDAYNVCRWEDGCSTCTCIPEGPTPTDSPTPTPGGPTPPNPPDPPCDGNSPQCPGEIPVCAVVWRDGADEPFPNNTEPDCRENIARDLEQQFSASPVRLQRGDTFKVKVWYHAIKPQIGCPTGGGNCFVANVSTNLLFKEWEDLRYPQLNDVVNRCSTTTMDETGWGGRSKLWIYPLINIPTANCFKPDNWWWWDEYEGKCTGGIGEVAPDGDPLMCDDGTRLQNIVGDGLYVVGTKTINLGHWDYSPRKTFTSLRGCYGGPLCDPRPPIATNQVSMFRLKIQPQSPLGEVKFRGAADYTGNVKPFGYLRNMHDMDSYCTNNPANWFVPRTLENSWGWGDDSVPLYPNATFGACTGFDYQFGVPENFWYFSNWVKIRVIPPPPAWMLVSGGDVHSNR